MHFDLTTGKGLKVTPSDLKENRAKGEQEKDKERVEEKRLTFLLIFISRTLNIVSVHKSRRTSQRNMAG